MRPTLGTNHMQEIREEGLFRDLARKCERNGNYSSKGQAGPRMTPFLVPPLASGKEERNCVASPEEFPSCEKPQLGGGQVGGRA